MAGVELRRVVKTFGSTRVIHGLDLGVSNGEFVVFVGPSGCGKSTLLRMIAGSRTSPRAKSRIGGGVVNDVPPTRARHRDGVPELRALSAHDGLENIGFGAADAQASEGEIDKRVRRRPASCRLEPSRAPPAAALRRPAPARRHRAGHRAQTAMFLFDEPLSNLDAELRVQMRTEIKELHSGSATTMIYVTHDQVEAMTLADKIVVLSAGHLMQLGSPDDIYHRPTSRFVAGFTGSPPMNFLQASVTRPNGVAMVRLGGGGDTFALPHRWQPLGATLVGRDLELGIRPEDIGVEPGRAEVAEIGSKVIVTEPLGAENLITLSTAGGELTGRFAPIVTPRPDEPMRAMSRPRQDASVRHAIGTGVAALNSTRFFQRRQSMLKRSRFLMLVGALIASLIIPVANAQTTLRVFAGGQQQRPDLTRKMFDEYEKRNPGVKITLESGGATSELQRQYLSTVLGAKDATLDVFILDIINPAQYHAAGWIEPLDQYLGVKDAKSYMSQYSNT